MDFSITENIARKSKVLKKNQIKWPKFSFVFGRISFVYLIVLAFGQYCFKIPDFFWVAQDIYIDQIFLLFTASIRSQSLDQPLVPGVFAIIPV